MLKKKSKTILNLEWMQYLFTPKIFLLYVVTKSYNYATRTYYNKYDMTYITHLLHWKQKRCQHKNLTICLKAKTYLADQ